MSIFRSGKLRFLYLLALAQLVGGPLVLLHVTLFSKLLIREVPRVGITQAIASAWDAPEFQQALVHSPQPWKHSSDDGKKDGKAKPQPPAAPDSPWMAQPLGCDDDPAVCGVPEYLRTWSPQWPHAPPGPPPRIG